MIKVPVSVEWVISVSRPIIHGATKPARLPKELITAIPTAAEAPPRKAVGRLQKSGRVLNPPAAPIVKPIIAITRSWLNSAAIIIPRPLMTAMAARCQRRSLRLSALREAAIMVTIAAA
ncbi:hypothetical protein AWI37_22880 [Klebsiella aerogenes]|nr:hypothetical protein AWI08_22035 [Klebsiella aerogenes]KUR21854.1 hypothetical protein AWI37_22880 [Klebsiella aerogenes]KZQ59792.1 hypothetical protein A3N50_20360 [Klebsiella aerogenes]